MLPGTKLEPLTDTELVGANGAPIEVNGSAFVTLTIAQVSCSVRVVIVERLTTEAILGMDFLMANNCTIQVGKKLLEFPKLSVLVPLICRRSVPQQVTVKPGVFLAEMVRIPPASEMEVMATAGADSEQDWILEGEPREKLPVMMAHAVVRLVEGRMPVRILNLGADPVTIYQGTRNAHLETLGKTSSTVQWPLYRTSQPKT